MQLKWDQMRMGGSIPPKIINTCTMHNSNLYLVVDNGKQNDLYSYGLNDKQWKKLYANIPFKARYGAQFVMHLGRMYCYGGSIDFETTVLLDDLLEIDVLNLKFKLFKNAPAGRVEHSMCVFRNKVFVMGGRTQKKIYNDFKFLDLINEKWQSLQCEPSHRFGHQLTTYEDTIIVTGGSDGKQILQDVWLYIDLRTWIKVEIKNPTPLFRHQATLAMKEYLIVFGGCSVDNKRHYDTFVALNLVSQRWIELPKFIKHPGARIQHTVLTFLHQDREEILIIGGSNYHEINVLDFCKVIPTVDLQPQSLMSYRSHTVDKDEFFNDIPQEVHYQADDCTSFLEFGKYYEWKLESQLGLIYTPRTGHSVVQMQDFFILFGGADDQTIGNDMYIYIIGRKLWEKLNCQGTHPSARSGCKGIVHQQDLYYFGGYTSRRGEYFNDLYQYFNFFKKHLIFFLFFSFDIRTKIWNIIKANKDITPRVDMTMVQNNSKIYIFGGSDGTNRYNDLHCYDINLQVWNKLHPHGQIPSQRFGHTAEVYRNQMYVFGGWNGYNTLDELYTYSFASNYWYLEKCRTKPPSRYRHASTLIGCCIYIFGGVDTNMTRFDDLFEYNCETRDWKFIETAGNTPTPRTFHQLTSYETKLYLIGGNDGVRKNNDMYSIQVFDNRFSDFSSVFDFETHIPFQQNGLVNVLKNQVQELEQRLKEEQEFILCQVCFNKDINSVFLECGHRFCCYDCSNRLELCKICKKPPARILKIYVV